jgi:hypothetical protein
VERGAPRRRPARGLAARASRRTDCPIACDVDTLAWRDTNRVALDAFCAEIELEPSMIRLD